MKKSLALVLVLAMAFALAIPAALAEGRTAEVGIETEVKENGEVVVTFTLPAGTAPGAATYDFYFGEELEWVGAVAGELMQPNGMAMFNSNAENTQTVAIATGGTGNENAGAFAINTLKIKDLENFKGTECTVTFESIFEADAITPMEVKVPNDGKFMVEAPVAPTTEAPVETTEAPVETTEAPVETTKAPVETTKAPETTEVVETEAPETKAPETKAPETKAPETNDGNLGGNGNGNANDGNANTNKPPKSGAMSMVAIAAISAISGMGALSLRRKEH